jgi:hypothetical protein
MPVGFRGDSVKTKDRPLDLLAHLKKSIMHVNAKTNCLAHALIIAIARVDNDPNYNSFQRGYKIPPEVDRLLKATGMHLSPVGEFPSWKAFSNISTIDTKSLFILV